MSKYRIGQIVQIDLGKENTTAIRGHEQAKERRCVIIRPVNQLGLLVVVPFTKSKPKNEFFKTVKIEKNPPTFTYDSYALCHQIRTVSTERVTKDIGQMSAVDMGKIKIVLAEFLGL